MNTALYLEVMRGDEMSARNRPKIFCASNRHGIDWQKSLTEHGHPVAEVLSAVIKEVRRGKEEESLYWALEMAMCGRKAEEFLWECLIVCVPEDIGLANPEALPVIKDAREGYFSLPMEDKRRFVFLVFVISYLCRSKKSRYVSELLGDVMDRRESGELNLKIPDYAVDKHTARGRRMGRGTLHYLEKASLLKNQDKKFPTTYFYRLLKRARK
jgi:replication-associated recombination protein RarA